MLDAFTSMSVPSRLPPPHPPRGRKRDLYYDPIVFAELDQEVFMVRISFTKSSLLRSPAQTLRGWNNKFVISFVHSGTFKSKNIPGFNIGGGFAKNLVVFPTV